MKKSFILLGVLIVFMCIAPLIFFLFPKKSPTEVSITFLMNEVPGAAVTLYKNKDKSGADVEIGQKVGQITNKSHYKLLQSETYVVSVSGEGINSYNQIIYPSKDKSTTVRLQISLTKSKLDDLLQKEKDFITQHSQEQLQEWLTTYKIDDKSTTIVSDGSWAVVKLLYAGKERLRRDSLFIILQKQGHYWKLITKPSIAVSKLDYPTIPDAVILEASPSEPPVKL